MSAQFVALGCSESHPVRALFGEDQLPLVVAQRQQRAVVAEVEELVARIGGLAGEELREVVAVEVDLEGGRWGRIGSRKILPGRPFDGDPYDR